MLRKFYISRLLIWLIAAIGGATGQLLEQSAQALDQISTNFSAFKVLAFTYIRVIPNFQRNFCIFMSLIVAYIFDGPYNKKLFFFSWVAGWSLVCYLRFL